MNRLTTQSVCEPLTFARQQGNVIEREIKISPTPPCLLLLKDGLVLPMAFESSLFATLRTGGVGKKERLRFSAILCYKAIPLYAPL